MFRRDRVLDNWDRLVNAVQKSGGVASGIAKIAIPSVAVRVVDIERILQAADEIEAEDINVARILCEQAYAMAHKLDPSNEWGGVMQFRTGWMSIIKQKPETKGYGPINREHDIEDLWKFYLNYKRRMEVRAGETKEVYVTLGGLLDVLEFLIGGATNNLKLQILDEVRRIKRSDEALKEELWPNNIVPLDKPYLTNVVGFFPEGGVHQNSKHNDPNLQLDSLKQELEATKSLLDAEPKRRTEIEEELAKVKKESEENKKLVHELQSKCAQLELRQQRATWSSLFRVKGIH